MRNYYCYFLSVCLIFDCSPNRCNIEADSKIIFEEWIEYIEKFGEGSSIDSLVNCYKCLDIITGLKGQGVSSNHPILVDPDKVEIDLQSWRNWYNRTIHQDQRSYWQVKCLNQ